MCVENRLVRAGRGIEGDLLPDFLALLGDLFARVSDGEERLSRELERTPSPSGLGGASFDVGHEPFAEKVRGVERVNVKAVAELAREPCDVGIHAGDEDRYLGVLDRTRAEERRHQRVLVELALEIELRAVLPAVPDRAQRENNLAELLAG